MDSATTQEKLVDFQHLIAVETARKQIRNAQLLTVFTGVAVIAAWLVGTFVANISGGSVNQSGSGYYWTLEVLFIFGMGYGISRYNVLCSRLMFGYSVVGALHALLTIGVTSLGISARIGALSYKIYALYYLWIGIDAMQRYHLLMKKERSLAADGAVNTRSQFTEQDALQPRSAPAEPLNPTPELVGLCGGDSTQAQWLLSKAKSKHPDRSVAWCNQQVIEQLST
ncbi:hypothetical protein [Chamaesiphon sp.]|uniref:hypothetical protein n=1 Tax=Chamaesiphon sp. TaxID=2814140 RepID=UPI00359443F3